MTDKEKLIAIRAEIERKLKNITPQTHTGVYNTCIGLLSFIDSLQEEPVIEDLKEAARKYEENRNDLDARSDNEVVRRGFVAGANWQKQQIIEKACEWVRTHRDADFFELIPEYNYCGAGNLNIKKMVEEFRKYLEE